MFNSLVPEVSTYNLDQGFRSCFFVFVFKIKWRDTLTIDFSAEISITSWLVLVRPYVWSPHSPHHLFFLPYIVIFWPLDLKVS